MDYLRSEEDPRGGVASRVLDIRRERIADAPTGDPTIAVLLPCRNEAVTIAKVIHDFKSALPRATVYVYDNASVDRTVDVALQAGAIVRHVRTPGKGNVIRQMFAEVEADIAVLADGDDTYDALAAPAMVRRLEEGRMDMIVGRRIDSGLESATYRIGHRSGNVALTSVVSWIFGSGFEDMLSGYRVMSRRYMKSFPALSTGFETETEMTVHALDLRLPFEEVETAYKERPSESKSNLRTLPDGFRILRMIMSLSRVYRPIRFYGIAAILSGLLAMICAVAHGAGLFQSLNPGLAALPLAALAVTMLLTGLVLDAFGRSQRELKRMLYLAIDPGPRRLDGRSEVHLVADLSSRALAP